MAKRAVVAKKRKWAMKGRRRGGASVECPTCHNPSRVIITRRDGDRVVRRRTCVKNRNHSFATEERVVPN